MFDRTGLAEVAGPCAEAEGLPGSTKKYDLLQVGNCGFCVRIWLKVYEDQPDIGIQDLSHLLGSGREWRADETLAVDVTAELTFKPNPGGGLDVSGRNDAGRLDARFLLYYIKQFFVE